MPRIDRRSRREKRLADGDAEDGCSSTSVAVVTPATLLRTIRNKHPGRTDPYSPVRVRAGPLLQLQACETDLREDAALIEDGARVW
jgi:hypothetical protein